MFLDFMNAIDFIQGDAFLKRSEKPSKEYADSCSRTITIDGEIISTLYLVLSKRHTTLLLPSIRRKEPEKTVN